MRKSWPLVTLVEVLKKSEESVSVDPNAMYREVTIKLWGKGVVQRREASGTEMAASRRAVVRQGQFILSRIDARNGAFGLVPGTLDGAVVSNDFPSFDLYQERLEPKFLEWLSKTSVFVDLCKAASEGTTNRVRLKEQKFLAMAIPLPPLTEQQRIVTRIEELAAKIEEARGLRRHAVEEAEALVVSARNTCFHELSTDVITRRLDAVADSRLGKMLSDNRASDETGTPYIRNANVQWDRLDLTSVYRMNVSQEDVDKLMLEPGDILVCEGGDIGKSAIWNNEIPGAIYQKALHRIRVDRGLVEPRFLLYHIFWASEQGHFSDIKTQTTIAHLTGVKLKAYPVYVPSLTEQRRIVAYLDDLQAKVDSLKRFQTETSAELDAMLPSILDKAFREEL
jgi:type I restriction enzyme S subunit